MKTVVISRAAVHTGSLILVNPAHPVRNIPLREELQPPFCLLYTSNTLPIKDSK